MAFVPYPEGNLTSDGRTCRGTGGIVATSLKISGLRCLYDPWGGMLSNNTFSGNGFFGNPGNADYANLIAGGGRPVNCFSGNVRVDSSLSHVLGPATSANAEDGHPDQTPDDLRNSLPVCRPLRREHRREPRSSSWNATPDC